MDLNTCRKQWKEQRKQNKIENLKNTQHKLSKDVYTLQMQVTLANKPGWMLDDYEAVYTMTWVSSQLNKPQGI